MATTATWFHVPPPSEVEMRIATLESDIRWSYSEMWSTALKGGQLQRQLLLLKAELRAIDAAFTE